MKNNFSDKIDNVEKMLSNWSYRYLTPFGKVTVVKSLGLSKLSHVALVIPNPTKDMMKRVYLGERFRQKSDVMMLNYRLKKVDLVCQIFRTFGQLSSSLG